MNWNPYKRRDYQNMTDAELEAEGKSLSRKQMVTVGVNVAALVLASVALCAIFWPAVFPAIPVYISNFMVAGAMFSSTRFSTLKRACSSEQHTRRMAQINQAFDESINKMGKEARKPKSAPAEPAFNHAAATVLDDDIEVNKPLTFKKKPQPGATV